MRLFLNATSPFARVARVAALEKGCAHQLELIDSDPWNSDSRLLAAHPQLRVPVLITPEGHAISESLLIAQYLDSVGTGAALVPAAQAAQVLAATSVAYGLMESAFGQVIARRHGGAAADETVLGQRRLAAIARALQWLEAALPDAVPAQGPMTLALITAAVALEYVCFRLPALLPEAQFPQLHAWLAQALQRPSLAQTRFIAVV